jgi:hypothetical protein
MMVTEKKMGLTIYLPMEIDLGYATDSRIYLSKDSKTGLKMETKKRLSMGYSTVTVQTGLLTGYLTGLTKVMVKTTGLMMATRWRLKTKKNSD